MSNSQINIHGTIVDADTVSKPDDRSFRAAWQLTGNIIDVDMTRARDIHRDRIRAARKPAFAINDIAINDAMLADDEPAKTAAAARRDVLRNAPADPAIEAAVTPEALTGVWPASLSPVDEAGARS